MRTAGTDTFLYDLNGNVSQVVNDSGLTQFEWNKDNRLTKVIEPNGTISNKYNGEGQRIEQTHNDTTSRYVWDVNDNEYADLDVNGNTIQKYLQGPKLDNHLALVNNVTLFAYHLDVLGSVVELTDVNKNVKNRYRYSAFGSAISATEDVSNNFRFTGRRLLPTSLENYYLRERFYTPVFARSITKDRHPGFMNLPLTRNFYLYVMNNPLLYADGRGLNDTCNGTCWHCNNLCETNNHCADRCTEEEVVCMDCCKNNVEDPCFDWCDNHPSENSANCDDFTAEC